LGGLASPKESVMSELFITEEGKKEKEERLRYLKNVKRLEVLDKLKVARDFGDLSENSEYDAAKKEQSFVETEIAQIEETLRKATIVDTSHLKKDQVNVGSTVVVFDMDFEEEDTYKIVGVIESDPNKNFVSNESPIGSALLGKKVGDIASFETPGGMVQMKIIKIS
jgi:transcription elongation factor GreA